jgi:hypothetical protein
MATLKKESQEYVKEHTFDVTDEARERVTVEIEK